MRRSKGKKQGKFKQIIVSPIRILRKARDFYMKGIENCAGRVGNGAAIGCPSAQVAARLPKSFSANSFNACSIDEEFRQLLRATSARNMESKLKEIRQTTALQTSSNSVGVGKIGRIDEDEACEFQEDGSKADLLYPRSRSHVVKSNLFIKQ
ncbi:3-isopropylmalate dehydratase large subunit like [Melia azedarach]|uniref:3-isopropylmalate dehydratase large subunit like n=1 Tax=Melia azedarach TaxID=155640 RepID=A0ACC1XYA9_MELAZ|nr:3-isopropylmalate dehydratase large subunit like [Melia azedarach]